MNTAYFIAEIVLNIIIFVSFIKYIKKTSFYDLDPLFTLVFAILVALSTMTTAIVVIGMLNNS